jgi:hypothetical protein
MIYGSLRERSWPAVLLGPITAVDSIITVSSTLGLHPKTDITLTAIDGVTTKDFEIKQVISQTQIQVGPVDKGIGAVSSAQAFNGGMLQALQQDRTSISSEAVFNAVYMEEPTVAFRMHPVDYWGNGYTTDNPLPVSIDTTISIGAVTIVGPAPNSYPMKVNADGSTDTLNLAQLIPFEFNEIDLTNSVIASQTVPTTVVYKQAGVTVATLTLTYDGSANLLTVVRT